MVRFPIGNQHGDPNRYQNLLPLPPQTPIHKILSQFVNNVLSNFVNRQTDTKKPKPVLSKT